VHITLQRFKEKFQFHVRYFKKDSTDGKTIMRPTTIGAALDKLQLADFLPRAPRAIELLESQVSRHFLISLL
jgi:hypothetical protein